MPGVKYMCQSPWSDLLQGKIATAANSSDHLGWKFKNAVNNYLYWTGLHIFSNIFESLGPSYGMLTPIFVSHCTVLPLEKIRFRDGHCLKHRNCLVMEYLLLVGIDWTIFSQCYQLIWLTHPSGIAACYPYTTLLHLPCAIYHVQRFLILSLGFPVNGMFAMFISHVNMHVLMFYGFLKAVHVLIIWCVSDVLIIWCVCHCCFILLTTSIVVCKKRMCTKIYCWVFPITNILILLLCIEAIDWMSYCIGGPKEKEGFCSP